MIKNYSFLGLWLPYLICKKAILFHIFLFIIIISSCSYASDFDVIKENVVLDILMKNKDKIISKNNLHKYYNNNGKYNNINYSDNSLVNWSAYSHMDRLFYLTITYTHPESAEKGNKILLDNIINGLNYWVVNRPTSKNWWFNKIAIPNRLSAILLLLNDESLVPANLKNRLVPFILHDYEPYDGSNRTQILLNHFVVSIITKNPNLLTSSRKELLSVVKVSETDGIQSDYSFHAHGNQLYTFGYGTNFIEDVLNFSKYIRGTKYQLSKEQLSVITNFILYGYNPIFRNQYIDFNATGRALSRINSLKSNNKEIIRSLAKVQTSKQDFDEINEIANIKHFNRYYWKSDFLIHYTPNVYYSIRAISDRTEQAERGNDENIKGGNLSLGSTNIRANGGEYYNIFATWDWNMVPGTTTTLGSFYIDHEWGTKGNTSFVGGATIPKYSTMTFELDNKQTKAYKLY